MKKIILLICCIYNIIAYSQELIVTVDKNTVQVNEQIEVQFSINRNISDFVQPKFDGFRIISGPNKSSSRSFTYVNGKSENTVTTTLTYYIQATKLGTLTIKSAKAIIGNTTIESKPIKINVIKTNQKKLNNSINKNLFIKASVSKQNIFKGEQITTIYKLYTRLDLLNTEFKKIPVFNGFWTEELEVSSNFKRENINGIIYNVATIKKVVLTGQKIGVLSIDPMEIKCSYRIQKKTNSRDPFASFFNSYTSKDIIISSKPIKINVIQLPEPIPKKFFGLVGDFKVETNLDKKEIKTNDALNYSIKITGTGNFKLLEEPNIFFPSEFEIYDPKINEKIFEAGKKRSIKNFEYIIIPRYEGDFEIKPEEIVFFNPKKKSYQIINIEAEKIKITKSLDNDKNIVKKRVEKINQDIRHIKTSIGIENNKKDLLYNILFFIPIFFTILYLILPKKFNKNNYNKQNKRSIKIAQKRLKKAKKNIDNKLYNEFFEEVEKSLWGYFSEKFKINIALLSKDTIKDHFNKNNIDKSIQNEFIDLLTKCETVRYGNNLDKIEKTIAILNKAKEIIINVESQIK